MRPAGASYPCGREDRDKNDEDNNRFSQIRERA